MADPDPRRRVAVLLEDDGRTYAEEGGVSLRDEPAPLFQLLVLATLASTRIRAHVAAAAARELWDAGWGTPERMLGSTWQQRVDALGRGSYRRYDESTATALHDSAQLLVDRWAGDLRRLRNETQDLGSLHEALQAFPRLGPTGAGIFLREVQAVWPAVGPYLDGRARRAARSAGLSGDPRRLAEHVEGDRFTALAATLARLGPHGARDAAAGGRG